MKIASPKTKIVCTIGPASESPEVMKHLIEAGMNVARLNFSHGEFATHKKVIDNLRSASASLGKRIAIMADLSGPKMRIGKFAAEPIDLNTGDAFTLTTDDIIGDARRVSVSFAGLPKAVKPGDTLFLNDGYIQLKVSEVKGHDVLCTVMVGGELRSRKGLNLPGINLGISAFTERDRECLKFALENGVDAVSQSFVERADDIHAVRKAAADLGHNPFIIAKIERSDALDHIEEIIRAADGIMIARGDLGVEVPIEQIAVVQKRIMRLANMLAKPVITATQMLESMIDNRRPTRAEATDVANAVLDGADTLMLSGETSTGKFPVDVIRSMQKIIDWTEAHGFKYFRDHPPEDSSITFLPDSICYNACKMAGQTKARAIITFTHSGNTAFRISSFRPESNIFAFTMNKSLLPMLSLVWGVRAFYTEEYHNIEDYINHSINFLLEKKLIQPGDVVVHVGSIPLLERGKTNMVKLSYV